MFLLPFHVISLSHEHNPTDVVGRLRITPERHDALLADLAARGANAVLVSTCHRSELYWLGDDDLASWFTSQVLDGDASALRFERADADLAVRHLFAVSAGMRSARYGEPEILGQVRRAWVASRSAGVADSALSALFRQAIDAARHIRAAMGSDADPSLGERVRTLVEQYAAAQQARPLRLLVVGAGDAARGVLEALGHAALPQLHVQVTSRTDARAESLAHRFHADECDWINREAAIQRADVVVFAVHVTSPLVPCDVASLLPKRITRAMWVDLGVPSAVADGFAAPGVDVVSLAQLDGGGTPALHEARMRRAGAALQHELARCARATHRLQLGARLGAIEERAVAMATEQANAPADVVARRVTRLLLRELTRP
jgi:glutamyl-tRNA reductase